MRYFSAGVFVLGFGGLFIVKTVRQSGVGALPSALMGVAALAFVVAGLVALSIRGNKRRVEAGRAAVEKELNDHHVYIVASTDSLIRIISENGDSKPDLFLILSADKRYGLRFWSIKSHPPRCVFQAGAERIESINLGKAKLSGIDVDAVVLRIDHEEILIAIPGTGTFGGKRQSPNYLDELVSHLRQSI